MIGALLRLSFSPWLVRTKLKSTTLRRLAKRYAILSGQILISLGVGLKVGKYRIDARNGYVVAVGPWISRQSGIEDKPAGERVISRNLMVNLKS